MNEGNMLKRMDELVTGEGFIREVPIPVSACLNASGTAVANVSGVLTWYGQDDNDSITIPFKVPLDYDQTKDELCVVLTAELTTGDGVAGSNAIALDIDVVGIARPGSSAKSVLGTETGTTAYTSDSQNVALTIEEYAFNLSGLGLKPGDVLSIEMDVQEDGTAEVSIYAVSVKYRSDIVAYDSALRSEITDTTTND